MDHGLRQHGRSRDPPIAAAPGAEREGAADPLLRVRTGDSHVTPTQYAEMPDGTVVVAVGRPDSKTWWRNFRRPHPVDLLIRGTWHHGTGHARWRHDDLAGVDAALDAFSTKYGHRRAPDPDTDLLTVLVHLDEATTPGER